MSPERFDHLLNLVSPYISKQDTNFRKSINSAERLAVTLRFLASGESQQSLSFSFRIGRSTISKILRETCDAIFCCLSEKYLKSPQSEEDWNKISEDYEKIWNLPHVVGAIDGKHIRIQCPKNSGTLFHNYKGFFSLVLLAVCDARYCFSLYDVGAYGSNNDSGVLLNSVLGQRFENETINLPKAKTLEGCSFDPLPYFLVGDEIFPLKQWMMRPYPGNLTESQRIYNYRLSRSRRVIENVFGILVARWRIFNTPIIASVENAEKYVLATLALHNYLRLTDNATYTPSGFIDSEVGNGEIKPGDWRKLVRNEESTSSMVSLPHVRGSRYRNDALAMRESIKEFVNSENGSVEWQYRYVRRT